MCKPVELSQPSPFFLGLHLVTSEFLLPAHRHPFLAILCPAACGSGGSRYGRGLCPGAYGSVHSAALLVERVLDYRFLALVRDPTGFNVPNLRTYKA